MEEVNALKVRNNLGEILDRLSETGEPVFISKGRIIRAVLVTPEQFEKRFLDWQVRSEKKKFLNNFKKLRKGKKSNLSSLTVLRELRGYQK
jgi:antitoxin (DNA-binding transcriptional repressor) of toxin-antitoxin stability system